MHPYEMAATLKRRHKHESIKLRYGTLYTVIELLTSRGLIRSKELRAGGRRPERTVYALTPAGRGLRGTGCGICWRNRQKSFRNSKPHYVSAGVAAG